MMNQQILQRNLQEPGKFRDQQEYGGASQKKGSLEKGELGKQNRDEKKEMYS